MAPIARMTTPAVIASARDCRMNPRALLFLVRNVERGNDRPPRLALAEQSDRPKRQQARTFLAARSFHDLISCSPTIFATRRASRWSDVACDDVCGSPPDHRSSGRAQHRHQRQEAIESDPRGDESDISSLVLPVRARLALLAARNVEGLSAHPATGPWTHGELVRARSGWSLHSAPNRCQARPFPAKRLKTN